MVVCLLIFQLEICCSSEKSKPLVTAHTARSQCKGWGHVSVPRQAQETGTGPPPMLELEDSPFWMMALLWRGSRKESTPEDPSSNAGCVLAVQPRVSCLTSLDLIVLIYKIGGWGRGGDPTKQKHVISLKVLLWGLEIIYVKCLTQKRSQCMDIIINLVVTIIMLWQVLWESWG